MEVESKMSSSASASSEKDKGMNTTKIEEEAKADQKYESVPEDEKSKRVIDKLKNLFRF
jgi:hypothetical protein